jgi:hypothetical protein
MSKRSSNRRRPTASHAESAQSKAARSKPAKSKPSAFNPAAALHRELTTKRRGELAELTFSLKAYHLGFGVSRPYGDSERYDVILDARELTVRGKKSGDPELFCPGRRAVVGARSVRRPEAIIPRFPSPPLWRVQVKCTTHLVEGFYHLAAHRSASGRVIPYLPGEIDFLAAYVIPEDTWYIVPLGAFVGRTSLLFRRRDDPRPGLYDAYREAWALLRPRLAICGKCGAKTLFV